MNEITGNKADNNYEQTIVLKNRITKNLLELGKLLKESQDNEYFKAYAESFTEYLGTPEISLSRSFAFKLIFNYSKWVIEFGVSQAKLGMIDSEKLYLTGTRATEENYEEWLERAETLSRSDIIMMVHEKEVQAKTQVKTDEYKTVQCPKCGEIFQVKI